MFLRGKEITFQRVLKFILRRVTNRIFKSSFNIGQWLGFHITKNYFHSPILNT